MFLLLTRVTRPRVRPLSWTLPAGSSVRLPAAAAGRPDVRGALSVGADAGLIVITDSSAPPTSDMARQAAISGTIAA